MTALCAGGGSSSPKLSTAAVVTLGQGYLYELLVAAEIPGMVLALPFLALGNLVASSFCGSDPPAQPTWTLAETTALLNVTFDADFFSGVAKLRDEILYRSWFDLCQCDSGPQPTPGAHPSLPGGTPTPTPSPPVLPSPCGSFSGGPVTNLPNTFSVVRSVTNLPGGATSMHIAFTNTVAGAGPHNAVQFAVGQYRAGSTVNVGSGLFTVASAATVTVDVPIIDGVSQFDVSVTSGPASNTNTFSVQLDVSCQQTPVGTPLPPAPPLSGIDNATLQSILTLVTLIQRQVAPFAYVTRATHSGLTGHGELSVQGLIGCKVIITDAIAGTIGTELGDPEVDFGLGWINWGNPDGWLPRQFLGHVDNLSYPANAGAHTRIGYSLAPGVVATLVELTREQ